MSLQTLSGPLPTVASPQLTLPAWRWAGNQAPFRSAQTFQGQTVSSNLAVTDATLESVALLPQNSELPIGIDKLFRMIGQLQ